MYKSIENTVYW